MSWSGNPGMHLSILNLSDTITKDDALRIRAEALIDLNQNMKALLLVQDAIEDGNKDPRLLLLYGIILIRKGDEKALSYLEEAYISLPHEPEPPAALGRALASQERYEEALTFLNEAEELNPDDPDLWITKAFYLNRMGRYEEALTAINQADLRKPGDQNITNAYAYTLWLANRTEEARSLAEESLTFDPSDPAAMDTLGCILLSEGKTQEALQYLKPAADTLSDDPEVLTHLADVYFRLKRDKEAQALYERAIKLDGGLVRAWRGYSNVLLMLGKYEEAASTISETFRHHPLDSDLIRWEQWADEELKKWYLSKHSNSQ